MARYFNGRLEAERPTTPPEPIHPPEEIYTGPKRIVSQGEWVKLQQGRVVARGKSTLDLSVTLRRNPGFSKADANVFRSLFPSGKDAA